MAYERTSSLVHSINKAAPIMEAYRHAYILPQLYIQDAEQHIKEIAKDGLIAPFFNCP